MYLHGSSVILESAGSFMGTYIFTDVCNPCEAFEYYYQSLAVTRAELCPALISDGQSSAVKCNRCTVINSRDGKSKNYFTDDLANSTLHTDSTPIYCVYYTFVCVAFNITRLRHDREMWD